MKYIIIAFILFCVYNAAVNGKTRRTVKRNANSYTNTMRKYEREQREIMREQERQYKEVERLAREQERQAAQLEKHEERIAKLEFRMEQAERDIEHWNEHLANLYAMLDYEMAQQEATVPGGREYAKRQNKIITLTNKVHTAENRLAKAEFEKTQAEKTLSA